jgi:hypothetical protein
MLYGTPPRREHRAAPDGALALFVRTFASTGQHRPPPSRDPEQTAQLMVRGLGALILLGLVAMTTFFMLSGGRQDASAEPRRVVQAPLTMADVFPDRTAGGYRITIRHSDANCRTATTGELGSLLADHGCSRVIRAGMVAPYGGYEVTSGLFDLADTAGAEEVDARLRNLVETGDGSFATLPAARTDALPTSQVGWHASGHYLLYCVITRTDGRLVTADDPVAQRITADLVDGYLGTAVQTGA